LSWKVCGCIGPIAIAAPAVERLLIVETPLAVEVPLTVEAPPAVATPLTANAMVDKTLWHRRTRAPPAPMVLDLVFMTSPPQQMHSFGLSAGRW
jgi:hypothetical protein